MLVTDTNILLRCSQGKAMRRVAALQDRGVRLATTQNNAEELMQTLVGKLSLTQDAAVAEVARVLDPFDLIGVAEYDHLRGAAIERLRTGGKSDWPTLAAAMALDAEIWSEDTDFFGVGVPVWTSHNTRFVTAEPEYLP